MSPYTSIILIETQIILIALSLGIFSIREFINVDYYLASIWIALGSSCVVLIIAAVHTIISLARLRKERRLMAPLMNAHASMYQ